MVTVVGSHFTSDRLLCKFGNHTVIRAGVQFKSSTLVLCASPPATDVGRVNVEISVTGGVEFTKDSTQFMYDQGARVTRAQPSVVKSSTSGQQVTVIGQYFRRSAELSCMFGLNDTVQALFMTSTAVQCGAPPRSSGVVKLAVSNTCNHRR